MKALGHSRRGEPPRPTKRRANFGRAGWLSPPSAHTRRFVVLGGCGAIGRIVVRDLFESHRQNHILIADFNEVAACELARSFRSRRVQAAFADATHPAALAHVLRGQSVVINCTQHDFNLQVMRAAWLAKVHYLDLGGLFKWTKKQLKLDRQFEWAGLTAVIGMGCAPGITNVLARAAVEKLERVDSIRIRVGSADFNPQAQTFGFPYSAQTIVEELTLTPWVYERGKFREVAPRTGWEKVNFPPPIGPRWLVRTRHSEVATLPLSFRSRGIKTCDFKVGFEKEFVRELVKRLRAGATARDFARLPVSRQQPNDYEISRVIATGAGRTITLDCHAQSQRRWQASAGDVDTACPPSIVAQMIVTGSITIRGVLPPEIVVPVGPFFAELRKRGMKIVSKDEHS